MKIDRKQFIKFYDERSKIDGRGSDVNAITGLLGEDLLLGVLQHYWRTNENAESEILSYKCTSGNQKGSRLDGWLLKIVGENKTLYQVELKNWAVYAIGGKELKLNASQSELKSYGQERWSQYFKPETIPNEKVSKVLEPMRQPLGYEKLKPISLVCFWFYIAESIESPYSKRIYSEGKEVHVFSASAYLRTLKEDCIEIAMPRVKRRMDLLSELILTE